MDPSLPTKDSSPFGYTFNASDFAAAAEAFSTEAPPLLTENENRIMTDFFNNTNYFTDEYNNIDNGFHSSNALPDFSWSYDQPPTVQGISSTLPAQTQPLRGFHDEHAYGTTSDGRTNSIASNHDPHPAATTLYSNTPSQPSQHTPNGTYPGQNSIIYGLQPLPDSAGPSPNPNAGTFYQSHHSPTVPTPNPNSRLPEQLAALLPHHDEDGSIDASIAAQFAQIQQQHTQQIQKADGPRPRARQYTYGTDNSFNPAGYVVASPHDTEAAVTRRLMHDLRTLEPATKDVIPSAESTQPSSPVLQRNNHGLSRAAPSDHSEDESSEDDDGRAPKRRRKSTNGLSGDSAGDATANVYRKSLNMSRNGKSRRSMQDDSSSRKRKSPSASQKAQRENLTEEQKRNNHILSEQKRRNLIKSGFEELHDLVPELRNGGLSKSNVLMEAANFLDQLIKGNEACRRMLNAAC